MEPEGEGMKTPKMCSRFYCDDRGDRYCCAGCPRFSICRNPCLNSPERCGLLDLDGKSAEKPAKIKQKDGRFAE